MNRIQVSLLGALLAFGLALPPETAGAQAVPATSVQTLPDFADLVEKFGPAVVNINTQARRTPTDTRLAVHPPDVQRARTRRSLERTTRRLLARLEPMSYRAYVDALA